MAIVLLEGFDHFNGSELSDKGWAGPDSLNPQPGRLPYGPQSASWPVLNNNPVSKPLPYTLTHFILGFAFNSQSLTWPNGYFAAMSNIAGVGVDPGTGFMKIGVDGSGTTSAIGTHQVFFRQWHYAELKVTPTTAELYLDGILDIPAISGTYTNNYTSVIFSDQVLGGNVMLVDDVYIIDPTTGVNTDYLGDICVETLYPISDGTYTQWTSDVGGSHWPRVSEFVMDQDASYVHTTGAGNKDSYGIGNPTLANTTVYGVQLNLGAKKNDSGVRTMKSLIRQGGTDYLGTLTALTGQYQFHSQIYDQDPTGSNWTYTTINGDEYGIELVS